MSEKVKLNPDEKVIKEDSAKREVHDTLKHAGTLALTDQRLIFIRSTSFLFFFFKKTAIAMDVAFDQIEKVKKRGTMNKSLQVDYTNKNGQYIEAVFKVKGLDDWIERLKAVINK